MKEIEILNKLENYDYNNIKFIFSHHLIGYECILFNERGIKDKIIFNISKYYFIPFLYKIYFTNNNNNRTKILYSNIKNFKSFKKIFKKIKKTYYNDIKMKNDNWFNENFK
jgi:hypothetical protein